MVWISWRREFHRGRGQRIPQGEAGIPQGGAALYFWDSISGQRGFYRRKGILRGGAVEIPQGGAFTQGGDGGCPDAQSYIYIYIHKSNYTYKDFFS